MSITLTKVSSKFDRLTPLGLACLQGYLKANDIPVKVNNFRTDAYLYSKVLVDPLYQAIPPKFILNHQDFPVILPLIDNVFENREVGFDLPVFEDIFADYASKLSETADDMRNRYNNMINYIRSVVIPKIKDFDTVAFSLDYLNIVDTTIASLMLRLESPETQIIWGGPSVTQSSEALKLLLKKNVFDAMVIGEGEYPLLEIAKGTPLESIPGVMSIGREGNICYQKGIQLDINSLPTPDYTDIGLDTFFQIASVYRSRGCTNRCNFCGEWKLFGKKFRVRSVKNVIKDIETIIERHNPEYMIFGESLINDDLDYFEQLCNEMIAKDFKVNFGTHFRANISERLAKLTYDAGFNDAWVGFEAFTDANLLKMNKGVSANKNEETIERLTEAGINVIAMLVVGYSNWEDEVANTKAVIRVIKKFSNHKFITENGQEKPLSIVWRPAPSFLIPGSFNYQKEKKTTAYPWRCSNVSLNNLKSIRKYEGELSVIPYEFDRPISDIKVGRLIKQIQDADRVAGFRIGGIAQHIIGYLNREYRRQRQEKRLTRKIEKIGVVSQRYATTS